jgi:Zn finger protein HypA/HybF involved in hydrogenase expression
MTTEIWLSTKAKDGKIILSQSVPSRWNDKSVSVTIECQDPISKGETNNEKDNKTGHNKEKLFLNATPQDGRIKINVPVPESWVPLPEFDIDYINITLECEDVYEDESETGYCPLCGEKVDLEYDRHKEFDKVDYEKTYIANCDKCRKRLVIYMVKDRSELKSNCQ